MLLLDWAALDNDGLRDDVEPINMLFSRATAKHIRELIVRGQTIVRDGRVTGVDLPAIRHEVLAQMRSGMAENTILLSALSALDQATARHYLPEPHCC
jgi:hypothetical protein